MDLGQNPFAALSLIVAPAILTNASSVLAMSTSNRLARAVDRARDLARQLENQTSAQPPADHKREAERRLSELAATEHRAITLLRVLRCFYVALGGFALATLFSLVGAVFATVTTGLTVTMLELIAVVAGGVAVGSLVRGSALLVHETGIAVQVMSDRAASVRVRIASRSQM
jgi:Protein of unknown function (DUF2721)